MSEFEGPTTGVEIRRPVDLAEIGRLIEKASKTIEEIRDIVDEMRIYMTKIDRVLDEKVAHFVDRKLGMDKIR